MTNTPQPGDVAIVHYTGWIAESDGQAAGQNGNFGQTETVDDVTHIEEIEDTQDRVGAIVDTTDVDIALESGLYRADRDYKPLEFEVGAGEVLQVIDRAVREMEVGEERTVTVEPEEGYGRREAAAVVEVPRATLEAASGRQAHPWRLVQSETGEVGWITAVDEETVTVDFNHDLAGAHLDIDLRLLAVRPVGSDATEQAVDG